MGIRGGAMTHFRTKVLGQFKSGISHSHLSKFKGKTIAIDWANIAHRFLSRSNNMTQFINEFINLIHKFARENIKMLFIFDGKPRNEKMQTIEYRKAARDKVVERIGEIIENTNNPKEDFETIVDLAKRAKHITLKHVNECKKLFNVLGIHYLHLEHIEADCIFKFVLDNGFADVCFSGDMDLIAYGCKHVIQDLDFKEDTAVEINYELLLAHLGISQQQLLMAFILSGTDWNSALKRSNFAANLELIKKYGDISTIISNFEEINRDLPEDRHVGLPNKFNWQFSISVYSEVLGADIVDTIRSILKQQETLAEKNKLADGQNVLLEYGKGILEKDSGFKYTKKYKEYIFWRYSCRLNLIPADESKQKTRKLADLSTSSKKLKN